MKKITITISAAFILLLTNCTKKDETTTNTRTKTELLTTGKWYVSAMTSTAPINYLGNGTLVTDLFSVTPNCLKDNSFLFLTNGTLTFNEEATKCNTSDPQTNNVQWQFFNGEQDIIIDGEDYVLQEINETRLVIKDKRPQTTNGVSHLNTITFRH